LDDSGEWIGQLQDISESGICSLFSVPFTPGVIVKLEILGLTLYGTSSTQSLGRRVPHRHLRRAALLDSSNITDSSRAT